jgi:hypothetical protein
MTTIIPNRHTFSLSTRLAHDVHLNKTHYTTTHPWLHPLLTHSSYTPIPTYVRITKPTGEDSFFGTIINNPLTVPHMLCLRHTSLSFTSVPELTPKTNPQHSKQVTSKPNRDPDVLFIFTLALEGLQGHPSTAHGGFLNVLFDEMMGQTFTAYGPTGFIDNNVPSSPSTSGSSEQPSYFTSGGTLYTANLSVNFRSPVKLPGTFIYRGWVTGKERRKSWVVGEIVDVGESKSVNALREGTVCADATSLWVTTQKHKGKEEKL